MPLTLFPVFPSLLLLLLSNSHIMTLNSLCQ
nr:MAG TPA: hypothetical protein [Caudoviricetes sp.]